MANTVGTKKFARRDFAVSGVHQVVFIVTALLALTWGQVNIINRCPEGWVEWHRSCYMLTKTEMMWRDVHSLCRNLGARMAVPSSNEENEFMSHLAAPDELWIDCTDSDTEGVWVCGEDDKTQIGYRNWMTGEPDDRPGNGDGRGADFARLIKSGYWRDIHDKPLHSMCEMKLPWMQCCTIKADDDCH